MTIITRFAPSPTGNLHVGNARIAVLNWIFAKKFQGKFILRIDDTDYERSNEIYVKSLLEDLKWLGLKFDSYFLQSQRISRYQEISKILIDKGLLYPCYENTDELLLKRKELIQQRKPPIYDRSSLYLSKEQKLKYQMQGRGVYYRFLLSRKDHRWKDIFKGDLFYNSSNISDPVVIKPDGSFTYLLSSVIDDMDFHITHILRGEDHITNTAIQINMFESLEYTPPVFGHLGLVYFDGNKISKRNSGTDIQSLKREFIEPMSINNFLFKSFFHSASVYNNLDLMVKNFDLKSLSSQDINLDIAELLKFNAKLLSDKCYEQIQKILKKNDINIDIKEEFWLLIRNNVSKISEIQDWFNVIYRDLKFSNNFSTVEKKILLSLVKYFPKDFTDEEWTNWLKKTALFNDCKKKDIFFVMRKILINGMRGPNIKDICKVLGTHFISKKMKIYLENYDHE
ncbi:MAG: glutamate--tRNA ligase [Rickettsia sp.]|nr:glutamate--tRNA ligase [Rickettsia sp.]